MQLFFKQKINIISLLTVTVFMLFNIWNIIYNTPMVPEQHWAQKIFYVHVPSAWVGFLSYFVVMISGLMFFVKGNDYWDRVGLAAAEIGTIFISLVLITGPIWATPIWGKPWTWEPRLTTTLLIFLTYIIYFMVREFSGTKEEGARLGSIISILAFLDVPLIYFAVDMWTPEAQAHPGRNTIAESSDLIQNLFLFSLVNFSFILFNIVKIRIHIEKIVRNINV